MFPCDQATARRRAGEVAKTPPMRNQEQEQTRVETVLEHVLEELRLDWMDIRLKWNTAMGEGSDRVACSTTTDFEYRQASMDWCLPLIGAMTDLQLRRLVVHEVMHVLLAPMEMQISDKKLANQLCELAVENVTRAVLEVLP
jgi:hypothetical protein